MIDSRLDVDGYQMLFEMYAIIFPASFSCDVAIMQAR